MPFVILLVGSGFASRRSTPLLWGLLNTSIRNPIWLQSMPWFSLSKIGWDLYRLYACYFRYTYIFAALHRVLVHPRDILGYAVHGVFWRRSNPRMIQRSTRSPNTPSSFSFHANSTIDEPMNEYCCTDKTGLELSPPILWALTFLA